MCDQLEIRERVFKNSIGESTVDPQRFSVRGHPDPVRRNASSSLRNSETARLIRQLDPGHLRPFREVDNSESVKSGKLNENAASRAVGICLERHRAHWAVEFDFPGHLLAIEINHRGSFVFDRTADRIFAIGGDVHIVHSTIHPDALYLLDRRLLYSLDPPGLRPV